MKVINLYGGPGSGKSTTAAGLYYRMKMAHHNVELVTEYAKDLVYADRLEGMLDQQEYIFAKQNNRLHRLRNKTDWVVTDSPILLSTVYVNEGWQCVEKFKELVKTTPRGIIIIIMRGRFREWIPKADFEKYEHEIMFSNF